MGDDGSGCVIDTLPCPYPYPYHPTHMSTVRWLPRLSLRVIPFDCPDIAGTSAAAVLLLHEAQTVLLAALARGLVGKG